MRTAGSVVTLAGLVALTLVVAPGAARGAGKTVDGAVNLNTAPAEVLALLPGVGPSKAESIIAYRKRHPFRTVDELVRIKGIGRKMVRRLRAHLAVGGPTTALAVDARTAAAQPPPPAPPPRPVARPLVCARWVPRAPSRGAQPRPSHGACPPPP